MDSRRPLVWLSADTKPDRVWEPVLIDWHVRSIRVTDTPSALPNNYTIKPVGVCDLNGAIPHVQAIEQWLERLMLPGWVALVTAEQLSRPDVRSLIKRYFHDYHTLPVDHRRLRHSLGHLWGMTRLHVAEGEEDPANYQALALEGASEGITGARSLIRKFSGTSEPLLICGENGTGREAAAHFAHQHSPRSHRPLVTVNCAALPPSLTQSELFGHERGAFTHAMTARKGRIEAADKSTLLLLGVDELNLEQQSALLRFLQEGQIERVGANQPVEVDVRIIATCGKPLEQSVREGHFRSDVFYRLGNLSVTMPPLRERLEDLPFLAGKMLEAFTHQRNRLSKEALMAIAEYRWPGNLRELQNRVRQAVLLSRQTFIEPEDLGLTTRSAAAHPDSFSLESLRAKADQQAISASLAMSNQNISEAARLLKISRVSLYRLMDRYEIRPPQAIASTAPYRTGEEP